MFVFRIFNFNYRWMANHLKIWFLNLVIMRKWKWFMNYTKTKQF